MGIQIIVNGAAGKMGRLACSTLEQDARFSVVGKAGRADHLAHMIQHTQADVVLDLTRADGVYQNAVTIIEAGARPVIGTSGLTKEQRDHLTAQCERLGRGGLIVPNFSLGVLLMMLFSKQAARFFPDAEIIEMHHTTKFDAPSSTAIKTAAMVAQGRTQPVTQSLDKAASFVAARGVKYDEVPVHAMRLPGVLAKQSVIFGGEGEQLTITHESIDRQCFMPGVLLACEKVMSLTTLVYGLETLI